MSTVSFLRTPKGVMGVLLVLAGVAGLVILAVMLIGTKNDLKSTRANLDETTLLQEQTRASLDQTTATLQDTQETLSTTETTLADTKDILDDTTAVLTHTETTLATTEDDLAGSQGRERALQASNAILSGDLAETTDRLENTIQINAQQQSALTKTVDAITVERDELHTDLADSEQRYRLLEIEAGTLDRLQSEHEGLRISIDELKRLRRPLVISDSVTGFRCTGSMEPGITCLDTARWLDNYRPADVVVGATIGFDYDCNEGMANGTRVSHRVLDIKIENDTYYFWPKGDASTEADGCWVPESQVHGYIIELYKDTRPDNADLRNSVNDAKAEWDISRTEYFDYIAPHCDDPDACSLPPGVYEWALYLLQKVDVAGKYWNCWLDHAKSDVYTDHPLFIRPVYFCPREFVFPPIVSHVAVPWEG